MIGQTVRQELFGGGDPLGQTMRVNRMSCRVIGVLEAKGTTGFGQDQDAAVLMPLSTFQRRIAGNRDIGAIYVSARDGVSTERVAPRSRTSCARRGASAPTRKTISPSAT
jgi:putative ABC transport system permease protein